MRSNLEKSSKCVNNSMLSLGIITFLVSYLKLVMVNTGRIHKRIVRMFEGMQELTCVKQVNELTKRRTL